MNIDHDWRERVDHADERLQEVEAMLSAFVNSEPYRIVRKVDGEMPDFTVSLVMTSVADIPRKVSLLLAEIFAHLRSSLDHLMCALAIANGTSPDAPPGTQFPIFKDNALFEALDKVGDPKKGSGLWQMRGAAPKVQTLIESLQPYHRATGPLNHPLWLIHDFAVIDKHRKPHLTGAIMEGAEVTVEEARGVDLDVQVLGYTGPFKEGTEIARVAYTVTNPTDYIVKVHTDVTYCVAFAPKGPGRGVPVFDTMPWMIGYLRDVVFPELEPFV